MLYNFGVQIQAGGVYDKSVIMLWSVSTKPILKATIML